jgi:16S rRNA (cytosine1402-N4)-methyltransferase
MSGTAFHIPVLVEEVVRLAEGRRRIVDCTVGGGGHAARLDRSDIELLAIDRDPDAIAAARARISQSPTQWLNASFGSPESLAAIAAFGPDFTLFDLGVSGHQLDSTERGFSFRPGAPLDMRMSVRSDVTAAELLNSLDERELERVFREYGDERKAPRLAAAVVRRRANSLFATSDHLVNAIRETLGPRSGPGDFARLFQAIRIALNEEIRQLELALPSVLEALEDGGIIAVISYHSGEDRVVKRMFRDWARDCVCPPQTPICTCRGRKLGSARPRKPIRPSADEVAENPRSRSAKLRVFRKADEAKG